MENYEVHIYVNDYVIDSYEENASDPDYDEDDRNFYLEAVKQFKEWNKHSVSVSTLKEYFNLLEKVSMYSDGQYSIYNEGLFIRVGD